MTDQEGIEYSLGVFSSTDLGPDSLLIRGNTNGTSGDHWVSCEFKFKDGKLIDVELLA